MNDPEKVLAYVQAGSEHGVMAPVYLFHSAHMSEVIRPGDLVLDLACGPANQLAQVARLNPGTRFLGIDLSQPMLDRARALIRRNGLSNVQFTVGDISRLGQFADASIDAVVSSMALHHLPTVEDLHRTFREIARVLKPKGGLYLADFGRLKCESSLDYFAHQYAHKQPELFTTDYLNSLRAAFSHEDFRRSLGPLEEWGKLYSTFGFPFIVVIKSARRHQPDRSLAREVRTLKERMTPSQRADFADLTAFFALNGLRLGSRV